MPKLSPLKAMCSQKLSRLLSTIGKPLWPAVKGVDAADASSLSWHSAQNLQLGLNSLKNPFDLEKLTADQKAALKGTITDTLEVKDFVRQIIANL